MGFGTFGGVFYSIEENNIYFKETYFIVISKDYIFILRNLIEKYF